MDALPHSLVNYSADGHTNLMAFFFDEYGNPKYRCILYENSEGSIGYALGTFRGGLLAELSIAPSPGDYGHDDVIDFNGISYKNGTDLEIDDDFLGASAANVGTGPSPILDNIISGVFEAGSPVVGTNVDLADLAGANVFAFMSFDADGGNQVVLLGKNNNTGWKGVFDGENVVRMTERSSTDYNELSGTLQVSNNGVGYNIPQGKWVITYLDDPEDFLPFVKDFVA